jgi:hypothetical protein
MESRALIFLAASKVFVSTSYVVRRRAVAAVCGPYAGLLGVIDKIKNRWDWDKDEMR